MSTVHYAVIDGIAVLTVDNPPVNALGQELWNAVDTAVARAVADPAATAIVLTGAGRTFVAGADITVFDQLTTVERAMERSAYTHAMLCRLEDSAKPLVAAIHGHALGGGLELALACHYRVATPDARLGQPEVSLGIIPGAGGTQRLPRLCGVDVALHLCTTGTPLDAAAALAAHLVDLVVDGDLLQGARQYAGERASAQARRPTRELPIPADSIPAGLEACRQARDAVAPVTANRAVLATIASIENAVTLPFDAGSVRERELFAECVVSTESRALRHLFFAERDAARLPSLPDGVTPRTVARAAVVGAGTMGSGIAMVFANAGIPVLLKDVDDATLDRSLATIRRTYDSAVQKGRLTPERAERTLALITPVTTYEQFGVVDLVVEAVFEDLALKTRTFAELAGVTAPDCILATNTSVLDVDTLAKASGRPAQVVGHHYFSPAHLMSLHEIVRGRQTSPAVVAASLTLARRLGKVPVVVGNAFGFVANRMLAYYLREAHLLLEEGASVRQIDAAMTTFGFPVGPFAMQDIAGLDVGARIRQHLRSTGRRRSEGPQSEIPDRLFALGRYGQKTGAGWYRYEPGSRTPLPDPVIDDLAHEAARRRRIVRRDITDEEIVSRVTTALANEGCNVLGDRIARRASDIDVVYCHGFGFPRHRGGPMFHAQTIGLPTVLSRVQEYEARFGDYWRPSPLLEKLVTEGRTSIDG